MGIMAATAIPLYHTYQQRAYGSEAALMVKRILDGQIIYFLENDKFFPEVGQTKMVFHDDPPTKPEILEIEEALKITIPVGHFLDFSITHGIGGDGKTFCIVDIRADFALFKDGDAITAEIKEDGSIEYY
jgi:hypothetical protein